MSAPTTDPPAAAAVVDGVWSGDAPDPASRARMPDDEGVVVRDGVPIAWASYAPPGGSSRTLVLLPTWSIVPSRVWKAQVPYLARQFRVVTFDGRGSGASGRPEGAAAYTNEQYAADALAVMDAAGVQAAALVGLSCGAAFAVHVAARAPERVEGIVAIAPSCGFDLPRSHRDSYAWDARYAEHDGWAMYNKAYWLEGDEDDYEKFLRFFFGEMFHEPHSTKQIEDAVAWGKQISPRTLADTTAGRLGCDGAVCSTIEPLCEQVACPVLVIHGTEDRVRGIRYGERLAELTGGTLLRVEGGGHGPLLRDPVLVNREIRRFAEALGPPRAAERRWTRARNRTPRVLYLSSPIGLGHARRDLAIARELRALHPELDITWLAQDPVTRVLEQAGEQIHPASRHLASESGHIEHSSGEHDLHAFAAIRRMDEILVNNFMVFDEVTEAEPFDLVVGDEAWDVDHFLHENPELKRSAYAWFTDFVGWLPMPDGGAREAELTADYNAEMIEHRARNRGLRDASVFVGEADDVVAEAFGPGLPGIRDWTVENFAFAGYVTGFDPRAVGDRDELRARLGYAPQDRVCLVTVGGSGVGGDLLRRVLDAVPAARRLAPDLRFEVVAGPRIDPRSLPRRRGVRVHGYRADLTTLEAACDVALVQGGLTTCMELTALERRFLYVPLRHHFEQNVHVRQRLERYRAGTHLLYEEATDPDGLAERLVKELDRDVDYRPVETDGAARAARMLADVL